LADIFISYARGDREIAAKLAAALEHAGYSVWWDRHIVGGAEFSADIERELKAARAVIVAWSADACASHWVKDEATAARDAGKLVPVSLDGAEPPMGFRQFQTIAFGGWKGDAGAAPVAALKESVVSKIGAFREPAQTTAAPTTATKAKTSMCISPVLRLAGAGVFAVVLFGAAAWLVLRPGHQAAGSAAANLQTPPANVTAPSAPDASVAVLPFENLSSDKDNAFFATGIQDEILTRLTKIGSLKVISRTSTAHFASRPDNLPEIAKQLGVANILEGSVQREGNAVRVNVQLIKASTDAHLWAEIYDRKLDNIFGVQSEIAIAIANALSAKVTGEETRSIALKPTSNLAAYDAYLRGLALFHATIGKDRSEKPVKFLKEAVRLDPNFALAWALLARCEASIFFALKMTDEQRMAARIAADTALRLNPQLPEAQLAQGFYQYYVERDYDGARRNFEQVHAKWPNDIESIFAQGKIAKREGRWDEAKAYADQAISLDPLRPDLRDEAVLLRFVTRDFASALRMVDDALNLWPETLKFIRWKANIFQVQGRLDEADAAIKPLLQARPEEEVWGPIAYQAELRRRYGEAITTLEALLGQTSNALTIARLKLALGDLYRLSGDAKKAAVNYEQARKVYLAELERQPKNPDIPAGLALVYCGLGDRDQALKYADKAISLLPVSKDAHSGPRLELTRVFVWARFGDRDHAIPAITRLLKLPSQSPLTPAVLRLDPNFDNLRGDARFDALLKEYDKP
jgi:TolB-like protein/Tfp pilus assembly protein PilF